ncbi:hypothetical protein DL95DRAFT_430566 [Leptodontidium sp. 2 PMI_412]|nr:hypothetical protein DL95DRAFT_430566 [Leptodontidium sp. 2 PMI_412]
MAPMPIPSYAYTMAFLVGSTWTNGATRRYWTVRKDGRIVRPVAGRDAEEHLQSVYKREYERLHALERLQSNCVETGTQTFVATGPWIERTRWPETYRGARRDILLGLAEMPNLYRSTKDYIIGRGSPDGEGDVVSSWQDERRIAALIPIIDDMLDRCEETVQHTSRVLLCWLRSTRPQCCYPKPFTLVALPQSKRKYRRIFKRFFALLFRAYRMPGDVRRRCTGLGGIWDHIALVDPEQETCDGEPSVEEDDDSAADSEEDEDCEDDEDDQDAAYDDERSGGEDADEDGHTGYELEDEADKGDLDDDDSMDENSGASQALGSSRGIDELRELAFQLSMTFSTASFTDGQPSSSLLVYFSGILGFLADAQSFLPTRKFTPHLSALIYIQRLLFLEYSLPYRAYPHIKIARRSRFRQHQHFETIRLRYITTGSLSALKELQSLRDFSRSDDGQVRYRGLASYFLTKAEELCHSLILKDNIANTNYGVSFVQHPQNGLADAYLELSSKACTTRRDSLFKDRRWDWGAICQYEKQADTLAEMLAGGLHTACGQLARASELLSLECTNRSSTGLYIRPFLDMLQRERALSCPVRPSTLLFRAGSAFDKPWPPARLTAILKKATREV